MLAPSDFFDLKGNPFAGLFDDVDYVWDGLRMIPSFIQDFIQPNISHVIQSGPVLSRTIVLHEDRVYDSGFSIESRASSGEKLKVSMDGQVLSGASVIYAGVSLMGDAVQIGKGTVIEPGVLIKAPTVVLDNTEVRHGAYIRGNVLVGDRCIVGHATEMKSAVLLGGSQAGHFAYVGDSILGRANLGAGTKLANLKIVKSQVVLHIKGKVYETGLRKFGAILGDGVKTGCNSVTAPGTLLGRDVLVYPNCTAKGYHPYGTIIKLKQNQIVRQKVRRDG